ncbi:MFS transporter, ACS family, allantoate permease, partial [Tremellales sp. Uapishka_1]
MSAIEDEKHVKADGDLTRIESAKSDVIEHLANGEAVNHDDLPVMQYTAEENRRVLRKIDWVLMSLTCIAYTLQYVDRSAMSYAAVFTFRKDVHLTGDDYAWLGSCYFLGYLFFEFPGGWILQRLPISKTMGVMITIWGGLLMCMAAPRHFPGMAAIRTLLGMAEALVTPGFVLLVSRFYKREEQPFRVGIWYCCNGAGSFIGALVSYGMGHVHVKGIPNWAWIFILNGGITVIFGIVFFFTCPEWPHTASFLTPHERRVALERVRGNRNSLGSKVIKWGQVKEALCPWIDPQGWAYLYVAPTRCRGFAHADQLHRTLHDNSKRRHLILQSYGYSAFQTILIGLPQAVLQVVFPLSGSYVARKFPNARLYVMMVWMLPSLIGVIIQYKTRQSGALLFGYYIIGSYVAPLGLCFAAPGANIAGTTKKVVVSAMVFISYAVGNIAGPHLFDATERPPYRTGMLACIICFTAAIPMCYALRMYYVRENARRDRVEGNPDEVEGDFSDLTDVENKRFRYAL